MSKSPEIKTKSSESRATTLKEKYQQFIHDAERLFPKVDQKLLLTILQFQTEYPDWEGRVLLKIVYPPGHNMDQKKELFYAKYGWMSSIEQHKTLRMKAIRMYIEEIERITNFDPDIMYVTGSATLSPAHSYSA